ncbi:MAG: hypothetical protein HRU31_18860 [Rhodobacteraceae bacterium]|nr:hypothetical protein [Paracoccaceae bacterium]
MFNDAILARCPQCGSGETSLTSEAITCETCGFSEKIVAEEHTRKDLQKDVKNALNMARARDVLQRWDFAG